MPSSQGGLEFCSLPSLAEYSRHLQASTFLWTYYLRSWSDCQNHCLAAVLESLVNHTIQVAPCFQGKTQAKLALPFLQVGPSIGATYAFYALLVQDWGIGGLRSFSHLNKQDEAALAAETATAS